MHDLPELDRTFNRETFLQTLRVKVPAELQMAFDRYIATIDEIMSTGKRKRFKVLMT